MANAFDNYARYQPTLSEERATQKKLFRESPSPKKRKWDQRIDTVWCGNGMHREPKLVPPRSLAERAAARRLASRNAISDDSLDDFSDWDYDYSDWSDYDDWNYVL